MSYVSAALKREVIERAGSCCEYCLRSQDDTLFAFHMEHIISEKHDGETSSENLALSCPACNTYKGSDIAAADLQTGKATFLYHPRTQNWDEHFRLIGFRIEPLTPEGRVTVRLLRFNTPERVAERRRLTQLGRYPCRG